MNAIKYIFAALCGATLLFGARPISDIVQNLRGTSTERSFDQVSVADQVNDGANRTIDQPRQPEDTFTATSSARSSDQSQFGLDPAIQARIDAVLGRTSSTRDDAIADVTKTDRVHDDEASQPSDGMLLTNTTDSVDTQPRSPSSNAAASVNATTTEAVRPVPDLRATRSFSEPIRHQAPKHERLLTPGNFAYLGAFRPPLRDRNDQMYAYGGYGMTFRNDGDPDGPNDGLPGSLFLVGTHTKQLVAEIEIPAPVISGTQSLDELPVAAELQAQGDITGGIRDQLTNGSSEAFEIGGLQYHDRRLFWTLYKYYNVESVDYYSHGSSTPFTSRPFPEGMWHLGPVGTGQSVWHSYKHAGYIFEIPLAAANHWFGGRNMISGLQIATGLNISSHGPAMYAYTAPSSGTRHGESLNAVPLVYNDISHPAPGFQPSDRWTGGAWLTLGNKHAVIIVGRKALGANYYGEARPFDCTPDKGFHGTPYQAQVLFYAPETLRKSARQEVQPTQVRPWLSWDSNTPGGDFSQYMFSTCGQTIGATTYDRSNNLLYICQTNAGTTQESEYEVLPIIHVFRIVE